MSSHPYLEGKLKAVDGLVEQWLHQLGLWCLLADLDHVADLLLQTTNNRITVLQGDREEGVEVQVSF